MDFDTAVTPDSPGPSFDIRRAKRQFSRVGWGLFAFIFAGFVVQLLALLVFSFVDAALLEKIASSGLWNMIISAVSLYLIGFPLCVLIMKGAPVSRVPDNLRGKVTVGWFLKLFCISEALMFIGSIIGNALMSVSEQLLGHKIDNSLETIIESIDIPTIFLFTVILAPVFEELVCRKLIIDRLRRYGARTAIFFSAVAFALIHGNFYQFFYAFFLGIILSYIYIRSGKIIYPIIMHALLNFFGAVVSTWVSDSMLNVQNKMGEDAAFQDIMESFTGTELLSAILSMIYSYLLLAVYITGIVFLIISWKKRILYRPVNGIPLGKGFSVVCLNSGFIVFFIFSVITIVLNMTA